MELNDYYYYYNYRINKTRRKKTLFLKLLSLVRLLTVRVLWTEVQVLGTSKFKSLQIIDIPV